MKVKILYIFLFLFFFHFFIPAASAQQSKAVCNLSVSVSGNSVTVLGSVTESKPGLDPSETQMVLSDDAGGPGKTSFGQDSITDSYTFTALPGIYRANIEGQSWSNPGGGTSTCNDFDFFTVGSVQWLLSVSKDGDGYVYSSNIGGIDCGGDCSQYYDEGTWITLEANPSSGSNFTGWGGECSGTGSCTFQMNGNRQVTANFGAVSNPPGNFSVTSGACYDWPNPKVETNFNPSSGADYYVLQKWFGSYYGDIYTGSYQQVDSYGDPNVSSGNTYYYQVVAFKNSGESTVGSGYWTQYVDQPSCGGPSTYLLSVYVASGSGTITGSGSGWSINCPAVNCTANVPYNTTATINASASTGYTFSSWNGACATQGSSCSLYMDQNRSTSVNFTTNNYTLSVSVSGSGSVSSSPAGINACTSQCSSSFPYQQSVTLTPSASAGVTFAGWSGYCSDTGSCVVPMDTTRSVGATFATNSYTLSVTPPTGGSIAGTGISCPGDCSETYTHGTPVILNANPSANYSFSGWTGDCSDAGSCQLTINSAKSVGATFTLVPFNYSLSNSGNISVTKGSGNVYVQNTITKNLVAGATQSVDLISVTPVSGVSYSISNKTCSPTCSSVITFTVSSSAAVGTHSITVTGSPLSKTTNFNLVITGSPFTVSCSASDSSITLGENVTYSSTVVGGRAPLTYTWSGTNVPTSPAPSSANYTRNYSTIGTKTAAVTVRDADNVQSTCPAATVEVTFNPEFEEF